MCNIIQTVYELNNFTDISKSAKILALLRFEYSSTTFATATLAMLHCYAAARFFILHS